MNRQRRYEPAPGTVAGVTRRWRSRDVALTDREREGATKVGSEPAGSQLVHGALVCVRRTVE
jgi:hypothetical protein